MKYLKVFTDFADRVEPLSDAETGRLFRFMMKYAESGEEPDISGNERFLWPSARQDIDRQRDEYKERCETNKKNRTSTNRHESSHNATKVDDSSEDKDEDKDKDKDKDNIPPVRACARTKENKTVEKSVENSETTPPTMEQAYDYGIAAGYSRDEVEKCYSFNSERGWAYMKNTGSWKKIFDNWHLTEYKSKHTSTETQSEHSFDMDEFLGLAMKRSFKNGT